MRDDSSFDPLLANPGETGQPGAHVERRTLRSDNHDRDSATIRRTEREGQCSPWYFPVTRP